MKTEMVPWAALAEGWQIRVNGSVWRVLSRDGDAVTMENATIGIRTGRPKSTDLVEMLLVGADGRMTLGGEQYLSDFERKKLHRERERTGLLDEPRLEGDVPIDPAIEKLAGELDVDPHDVAVAFLQIRLGASIVAERREGLWYTGPVDSFLTLPEYRSHLFMLHGIWTEDVKNRGGLDECHATSHSRLSDRMIPHTHELGEAG